MAFKRKTDTTNGDVFKFETPGQKLTGVYLGSIEFEGDYGPTKKHLFKTEGGIKLVFGQKHLTDLLTDEKAGTLVQVTFTGLKKMKKGNPMKLFTLDIDNEYQASEDEVAGFQEDANTGYVGDEDDSDDLPADEIKTAPVKAAVAAKAPSADRQQRVKELLSRNKAS